MSVNDEIVGMKTTYEDAILFLEGNVKYDVSLVSVQLVKNKKLLKDIEQEIMDILPEPDNERTLYFNK